MEEEKYIVDILHGFSGDSYTQIIFTSIVKELLIIDIEKKLSIENKKDQIEPILLYNGELIYSDNVLNIIYDKIINDKIIQLTMCLIKLDHNINAYNTRKEYSTEFFDSKYTNILSKYIYIKKDNKLCIYVSNKMNDFNEVFNIVKQNGNALQYASDELRNSKEIVRRACKTNIQAMKYASDEIKDNENFIIEFKKQSDILEYASARIKDNYDIILTFIQSTHGQYVLKYASARLQNNRQLGLLEFNTTRNRLNCYPTALRNDKEFILRIIPMCKREVLTYISTRLRNDKDIVLEAVKINSFELKDTSPDLKDDIDVVLTAVRHHGYALQYASNRLKDNKDVVLEAVKNDGLALSHVSDRLREDKDIVLAAIKKNIYAIGYVPDKFYDDKDVMMAAVIRDCKILKHASDRLKDDEDVVSAAIRLSESAIFYASERIKNMKKFKNI